MFLLTMVGKLGGNHSIIDQDVAKGRPNPLFYLVMLQNFVMSHLTIVIQIKHVTKYPYNPFKVKLNVLVLLASVATIVGSHSGFGLFKPARMVYFLVIITFVCSWHFILNVVHEIATALDIRIFCVKDKVSSLLLFRSNTLNLVPTCFVELT